MPYDNTLSPIEAGKIALNSYFALKDWINTKPVAGVETRANIENRVLGAANVGSDKVNSSVGRNLPGARLQQVFQATTGFNTRSGFGYVLQYAQGGTRHAIVAVRGTRPEMAGKPDLVTDARGTLTGFGDYGLVHKGFRTTFDSCMLEIARNEAVILEADVVHCVGHSLGGAVATLVAGHYAARGKLTKLYTFGSPRVGYRSTHQAFERRLGIENMFRVSHDLDPITMVGPFPFVHVNPRATDEKNYTCNSPMSTGVSLVNHDMNRYINTMQDAEDWTAVRAIANLYQQSNAAQARVLLGQSNWVHALTDKTLAILFKLFNFVLGELCEGVVLGLTAIDLLTEMLLKGVQMMSNVVGRQIDGLLRKAAEWARIPVANDQSFTATVIRAILDAMLARVRMAAIQALMMAEQNLRPLPLLLAGGAVLAAAYAI
jgi:triacylglycerol lipase